VADRKWTAGPWEPAVALLPAALGVRLAASGRRRRTVIVIAIVAGALLLATVLALAIRPVLVVALGVGLFIAGGSWQATASDEGPGETPNGVAGFWLAAVWILLPWLVGVAVGSLIASRRRA
jgi:hypothetical protein